MNGKVQNFDFNDQHADVENHDEIKIDKKLKIAKDFSEKFTDERIHKQIKKFAQAKKVISEAEKQASYTKSTKDDEYVKKELPKEIKIKVYDPSVTKDDEMFPKLNKYE